MTAVEFRGRTFRGTDDFLAALRARLDLSQREEPDWWCWLQDLCAEHPDAAPEVEEALIQRFREVAKGDGPADETFLHLHDLEAIAHSAQLRRIVPLILAELNGGRWTDAQRCELVSCASALQPARITEEEAAAVVRQVAATPACFADAIRLLALAAPDHAARLIDERAAPALISSSGEARDRILLALRNALTYPLADQRKRLLGNLPRAAVEMIHARALALGYVSEAHDAALADYVVALGR